MRGPHEQPKKSRARRLIIAMRKRNLSIYDIAEELRSQHIELSPTAVTEVLREEGFSRLLSITARIEGPPRTEMGGRAASSG